MPLAVMLIGVVVAALGSGSRTQQDVERRTEALTQGQIGLERMTRELRQADWVYFRSSSVVDLQAPVRATGTSGSVPRLVRFDCSGTACLRLEGPATSYPPPAAPAFTTSVPVLGTPDDEAGGPYGRVVEHDVFWPQRIAADGSPVTDFLDPTLLRIRLRLDAGDRQGATGTGAGRRILIADGVALRNRSTFR